MTYNKKHSPEEGNRAGVFWRAALGIVFLYLNFAANQLLGLAGIVITSGFFILAQYSPFVVRLIRKRREKRVAQAFEAAPEGDKPEAGFHKEPGTGSCDNHEAEPYIAQRTTSVVPIRLVSGAEQKGL